MPDRRSFLKLGAATAAGLLIPGQALARLSAGAPTEKRLSLFNTHTGERLRRATFWSEGAYIPETLEDFNYLLRDHRTDEITPIDPGLFDLLHTLSTELDATRPLHIISGYRSPTTNQMLRQSTSGVAKRSLHMDGLAADIRLPGRDLRQVRKAAMALRAGGVGYYPESDFVHVDTGRVRFW